jgi:hypothetical protein
LWRFLRANKKSAATAQRRNSATAQRRNSAALSSAPCLKTVYAMRHAGPAFLYVSKIAAAALHKSADRFGTNPSNRFGVAALQV